MQRVRILILTMPLLFGGVVFAAEGTALNQVVIDTLRHAPRLEMIKSNQEAVAQDLEKSRGRWYPKLDVQGGVGADSFSSEVTRDDDTDNDWDRRAEAGIYLTQRLYDGGEAISQIRLDKTRLASLEHRVLDNAESLALDAIIAALEVYRQRELVFLAEENAKAHREILGSLEERERAGAGSVADVTQTQARLSMAQASLSKTHASLQAAISNYQRLTGQLPGKIDMTPYPADRLPADLDLLLTLATTGNPKINAAGQDVLSEAERVNIAESGYHPYMYLELSSAYTDGVENQEEWELNNAAMLRMNWNLYRGGSDLAAARAAKARKRQTEADRLDLVLAVADEVKATWAQFQSARNEVREYAEAKDKNRMTKEIYLEQFGVAQRSLLDVLDSENEVFQSSSQLVTSSVNEHIAAYKLLALAGVLNDSLGVDPGLYRTARN
ncbi:MAG: channel protein TolC [Spartobacteria bacterium]|nr:channel protein TolC [Spartobacteria bacterium]